MKEREPEKPRDRDRDREEGSGGSRRESENKTLRDTPFERARLTPDPPPGKKDEEE